MKILFIIFSSLMIHNLVIVKIPLTSNSVNLNFKENAKSTIEDTLKFVSRVYIFDVFKNTKSGILTVKDQNGHIKLKDLKYFGQIGGGFQALNMNTEITYFDYNLKKLNSSPEPEMIYYCGNVSTYLLKIEKQKNKYLIKKTQGFTNYPLENSLQTIDSISAENIIDICFLNDDKTLFYDGNSVTSEIIVIQFKNDFGIYENKKISRYDLIFSTTFPIKVMRNNQYGYYGVTVGTPYKVLGEYNYNLAAIETENGTYGFIDYVGNEYF